MSVKKRFAVVDLETTGGKPERDKITEIGIVIVEDGEIVDKFTTLVNPGRPIPYNITRITGITDDMVASAPQFYEIAKSIVEYTDGAIFVAHNVRFDYGFLKYEFASLGYTFSKKQLCTVKLSRATFPGLKSYALGNLIKHFDISVNARHRALEDAEATAIILQKILRQGYANYTIDEMINQGVKTARLPNNITLERLHELPERAGVYYFYNTYGKVIYVGKSINIKKRVMQHFSKTTRKAERLQQLVHELSFEETGSELVAMLLESHKIKALQPEVNKAQRTSNYPYFIHSWIDEQGYINFGWEKSSIKRRREKTILGEYGSKQVCISHLSGITTKLSLCQSKTQAYDKVGPCFYHMTNLCHGACIEKESTESYNARASQAVELLKKIFDENFFLVLNGRYKEEKVIVLVEDGYYKGFGYIDEECVQYGIEEMKEAIEYVPKNPEANRIIYGYLQKYPFAKKVGF